MCPGNTVPALIMASSREYPERPLVGVGGVVIDNGRALLIRRASEPLRGEWSIPGGMLELGETLEAGCCPGATRGNRLAGPGARADRGVRSYCVRAERRKSR